MPDAMTDPVERSPARPADELLVVRCQLGDRPAFDELIARWNPPLWRYVRGMTRRDDLAADVLQEAWLRALRGIGRLEDGDKFRAWLFGIARRALMDHWRRTYREPAVQSPERIEAATQDADDLAIEDHAALRQALERLPDVEREALTLHYLRSLSTAEVADVLGVPPGTVKSRLFRARRLLRELLEHEGDAR